MTPTFPLARPARILQNSSVLKVRESPKARLDNAETNNPNRMTDFRPYESDSRPHSTEVANCASGNAATRMPLSSEILDASPPTDAFQLGDVIDLIR